MTVWIYKFVVIQMWDPWRILNGIGNTWDDACALAFQGAGCISAGGGCDPAGGSELVLGPSPDI